MCMPCGKSGHLEFGNVLGSGKRGYILFDGEPERWDVMYQFADGLFFDYESLKNELIEKGWKPTERNGLSNLFMWFHCARENGLSIEDAKRYTQGRLEKTMENYRGYEKKALESRYSSAMDLLR